jgi:hypothetical protein
VPFRREENASWDLVQLLWHEGMIRNHQAGVSSLPAADVVLYDGDRTKRKIYAFAEAWRDGRIPRRDYAAVALLDDDLEPIGCTWSDVFALFHQTGAKIAQPALTADSEDMWPILFQEEGLLYRETDFVECMCPILRGDVLTDEMIALMLEEKNGWGMESFWHYRVKPMAVLDATPVRHARPQGKAHSLSGLATDPGAEADRFRRRHDCHPFPGDLDRRAWKVLKRVPLPTMVTPVIQPTMAPTTPPAIPLSAKDAVRGLWTTRAEDMTITGAVSAGAAAPDVALVIAHLPDVKDRAENMVRLREGLAKERGAAVVAEFTEKASWADRLERRLTWVLSTGARRVVQLEDDVAVAESFWPSLRAMHEAWPEDLLCLAATHSMAPMVSQLGRRSYRTPKVLGWGLSMTRRQAEGLLAHLKDPSFSTRYAHALEDDFLAHYFLLRGVTPRHPCPTIVDHLYLASTSGGDYRTNVGASVTWRAFAPEDMRTPAWWKTPDTMLPVEPSREVRRLSGICSLCEENPGQILVKRTGREVCRKCLYSAVLSESVESAARGPARSDPFVHLEWEGNESRVTIVLHGSSDERKKRAEESKGQFEKVLDRMNAENEKTAEKIIENGRVYSAPVTITAPPGTRIACEPPLETGD